MQEEDRWKKLEVWRLADDLAHRIYSVTRSFPNEEIYGVTAQLRRAALSIPTNIVEGYARKGDRELARFLSIALGSLGETKYLLHFSHRLGYLPEAVHREVAEEYARLGQRLWKFYGAVTGAEDAS